MLKPHVDRENVEGHEEAEEDEVDEGWCLATAAEVDREELKRDRNPRNGADYAVADERAPIDCVATLIYVLHHAREEDHRRVDAEACDQRCRLANAGPGAGSLGSRLPDRLSPSSATSTVLLVAPEDDR